MTAVDEPPPVEFRHSTRRQFVPLVGALLVAAAMVAAINLISGRQWWNGLPMIPMYGVIFGVCQRVARPEASGYQARLPLRLTVEHLQVAGPDNLTLAVDWSNISRAEIRGRLQAFLVIEPVDPDQTQPALERWQWTGHGQSGPYEIVVPLAYMTPGRDVLRRELARRLPASIVNPN
ncbi:hypothetical protein [Micromonospora sp. HK10]|uniref:hypothetical protein n=1 Tax=Micromonospora sp. HK10 TaxID=1538294 RepID=UPI0012E21B05|nr:hypothetical protein [Micromonospora sp. HK10]